jgi:hypothetical protein
MLTRTLGQANGTASFARNAFQLRRCAATSITGLRFMSSMVGNLECLLSA